MFERAFTCFPKKKKFFLEVVFSISLLSLCGGCTSPCTKLSQHLCKKLKKKSRLCEITRQESARASFSDRRCLVLLKTWTKYGIPQAYLVAKGYQKTQKILVNMKYNKGRKYLAKAHRHFRDHYRELLRFSWTTTTRKRKRKRRRRRSRRKRKRKRRKIYRKKKKQR